MTNDSWHQEFLRWDITVQIKAPTQAEKIVEAACRLFGTQRFHEVRMDDVAAAAGAGSGGAGGGDILVRGCREGPRPTQRAEKTSQWRPFCGSEVESRTSIFGHWSSGHRFFLRLISACVHPRGFRRG